MRLVRKEQCHWERETAILTKVSRIGILGPVAELVGVVQTHGVRTLKNVSIPVYHYHFQDISQSKCANVDTYPFLYSTLGCTGFSTSKWCTAEPRGINKWILCSWLHNMCTMVAYQNVTPTKHQHGNYQQYIDDPWKYDDLLVIKRKSTDVMRLVYLMWLSAIRFSVSRKETNCFS